MPIDNYREQCSSSITSQHEASRNFVVNRDFVQNQETMIFDAEVDVIEEEHGYAMIIDDFPQSTNFDYQSDFSHPEETTLQRSQFIQPDVHTRNFLNISI